MKKLWTDQIHNKSQSLPFTVTLLEDCLAVILPFVTGSRLIHVLIFYFSAVTSFYTVNKKQPRYRN